MQDQQSSINRRSFMGGTLAAGFSTSMALHSNVLANSKSEKLVVGVMGMGGRGNHLARSFESLENVEVAAVCDVDRKRSEAARQALNKSTGREIKSYTDFRKILDDKSIDILVIATCNHWHAPAAIMGCNAGKHVYVEKPCSHNPHEGELMIEASKRHKRLIQHGTQRRSWPMIVEGIKKLHEGVIGRVYHAHCLYTSSRGSIGKGKPTTPPAHLDYDLWQGPAPRRPFKSNMLHYNWHWLWHWGNGEVGNNGVHYVDIARWGLQVDYPTRVNYAGGHYMYDDDRETPDTSDVSLEFGDKGLITWRATSCSPFRGDEDGTFVTFTGEKGALAINRASYILYDAKGKEVERKNGASGSNGHTQNLVDGIRKGTPLAADIQTAHVSALLCHLANISHRQDKLLRCDPKHGGRILNDPEAMKLWKREYEKGWEPKVG